ncbi:hypothetical protein S7335_1235 [Synechococcus sp. PCC 7335]|uniref:hypothetical protein n=1 Tax=Synechococcus sp. (strain ATCC 29403 / PCC 7335) TaxID=91464 RepID=UPI00017EB1D3|nr:hypothetical protein [Synechococcus sp. PCC 7335]EDX82531.1 hypothetical protein S7335_1235 [Synechococcus sp. PCC 7335]
MEKKVSVKRAIRELYRKEGPQTIEAFEAEVQQRSYVADAFGSTIIALVEMSYTKVDGYWQPQP